MTDGSVQVVAVQEMVEGAIGKRLRCEFAITPDIPISSHPARGGLNR